MAKESIKASVEQEQLTDGAKRLLVNAGSNDREVAIAAQAKIADGVTEALRNPVQAEIREGIMDGDIVSDIFASEDFSTTGDMQIPLDLLTPGTEKEHVAYTMPDHGKIPLRRVEGDYIQLNTYPIGSSIDCTRRYLRNARFDILRRMMEVLELSFVKKNNDDGWQTLITAGKGRGLVAYDADATAGQFTPKLASLMKTVVRRNGGGNSSSINRKRLTDLYVSPEAMEDMVSWGLDLISDDLRSEIHRSESGGVSGMYGVNFHDLDELGVGQEYQNYYTAIGGLMGGSDTEIVVGLDQSSADSSFLHPVTEDLTITEDESLHRSGLVGFYGSMEGGWAVLDVRHVLVGSF
jgi:hypothetical protein